ncbi:MAG: glycosyltransferase family 39 protein, partial [Anaerolineae bacterium]|nr:glycosyltransferase family 39 protein [Anaerolineae bacterium]
MVLLVAAALRLVMFGDAPPGLQHDEIFKAQEGQLLILRGDWRLFYPSNQGHEGLYVWLPGASYLLFGASVMMIKFPPFVIGMLTVALTYRVIGEIFNRRVAFIAAGLTAVSFWAVFTNRVGLRANLLPLVALLVVWGLHRLIRIKVEKQFEPQSHKDHRENGWRTALLTGLMLGLAIYTYTSSFALYVAYGGFIVTLMIFRRRVFRAAWRQLLLVGVLAGVLALPMVYIRLTDPEGTNRVSTISRPMTEFLAGKPQELIDNGFKLAGMAAFTGDPEWRYNVANRPLFVLPIGLLVYIGFSVALWRVRKQPMISLFLIFATVGLIPSLLTVSAPSYLRSILALPAVMLFVALAIDLIPQKRAVWGLGALVIAVTGVVDANAYFVIWLHNDEVHSIYRDDLAIAAKSLPDDGDGSQVLITTSNTGLDPLLFAYYQPAETAPVTFFDGRTTIALSDQLALLLVSPLSGITPPHADWLTAAQGTTSLPPLYRKDGKIAYEVYQLNAGEALQARLAQVQTRPVYLYAETEFPRGAVDEWAQAIPYPVNFGDMVQLVGVDVAQRDIATEQDGVNIQL